MKAMVLISGGLDSILAAKLIQEQGIKVIPLHFKIPFCPHDKKIDSQAKGNFAQVEDNLGAELKIVDISNDFLKLLENPRYGFGANMNPCIDCKILMLSKAKELMPQFKVEFIVTGEVLGQRPMSQHRQALGLIEKRAGLEGLLLRPLSAKLLPQTFPEQKGWVSRDKLLDFSGRTRRPQMDLAEKFKIRDYPNAAGGCLLTDPEFTKRLKELIKHQELNMGNVELLKLGRHFRLAPGIKLVVGRNEREDRELETFGQENDYLFFPPEELAGPTALGRGVFSEELTKIACSITCRYSDLNGKSHADIMYRRLPQQEEKRVLVSPMEEVTLKALRI